MPGLVRVPRMRAGFRIRLLIMIIDSRVPRINRRLDEISTRFDRRGRETNVGNMSESVRDSIVTLFFFLAADIYDGTQLSLIYGIFLITSSSSAVEDEISEKPRRARAIFARFRNISRSAIEFTSARSRPQRNVLQYITTKRGTLADER